MTKNIKKQIAVIVGTNITLQGLDDPNGPYISGQVDAVNALNELFEQFEADLRNELANKTGGLNIVPNREGGSHKTGSLSEMLTVSDIKEKLGFGANRDDDTSKVKHSWSFTVNGKQCAIWDYKGSRWSTFGPREAFVKIFGEDNVEE